MTPSARHTGGFPFLGNTLYAPVVMQLALWHSYFTVFALL